MLERLGLFEDKVDADGGLSMDHLDILYNSPDHPPDEFDPSDPAFEASMAAAVAQAAQQQAVMDASARAAGTGRR